MISPKVTHEMINEGDKINFTFQATGMPLPTISWYFNGAPVDMENTMKYMISETEFNPIAKNSTLTIMNVELSDMGTYSCNATNFVSSDTGYGELTVNGESYCSKKRLMSALASTQNNYMSYQSAIIEIKG